MKRTLLIAVCVTAMGLFSFNAYAQDVPKDTLQGGQNDPMYRGGPNKTKQNPIKTDTSKNKSTGTAAVKKRTSNGELKKDSSQIQKRIYPNRGPEGGTVPKM